jgi:hypothetical protein
MVHPGSDRHGEQQPGQRRLGQHAAYRFHASSPVQSSQPPVMPAKPINRTIERIMMSPPFSQAIVKPLGGIRLD